MKKDFLNAAIFCSFYLIFILVIAYFFFSCNTAEAETLRGIHYENSNASLEVIQQEFQEIEALGANLIRFQVYTGMREAADNQVNREEYIRRVNQNLDKLENVLQFTSLFIIVDLHDCPKKIFPVCIQAWETAYKRFAPYYRIIGVDVNEPPFDSWATKAQVLVSLANNIAPDKYVIIEPYRGSSSEISKLKKVKGKNIIYSPHTYQPYEITHQCLQYFGLSGFPRSVKKIGRSNKEAYKKSIKYVRDFQRKYKIANDRIYVGEFNASSCSGYPKYPDNRKLWIKDTIDVLNSYGWSWSFLTWRGNIVWDPHKTWNPYDNSYTNTDITDLLRNGFQR